MNPAPATRATRIRYALLAVATVNAFLLYLDRTCMTAVVHSESFQKDLGLDKEQVGNVLSSFFFAYALGQLPAGWLADRFGPRRMLVTYIVLWSLCTACTGFIHGLTLLIGVRFACGLAEAGAYPASARLIARWFPYSQRGRANSMVAFGGRSGNALALWLTGAAILLLGSWRPVLWIYGACGGLMAFLTRTFFRDDPETHPRANEAERAFIRSAGVAAVAPAQRFPWRELLRHRGLWLLSLGAFGMNWGWALLVTWLPKYLQEVRHLDESTANLYSSIVLACGMGGMLFGGWWCDALARWFGPVWGRRLPFVFGCSLSVLAYLVCPALGSPAAVCVACGLVAFAGDSVNPAVWALAQDIGGNQVAVTLAWSNMWGNFGAAAVAKFIPYMLTLPVHRADWSEVFAMCAGGFFLLGICVLTLDSRQRLCVDPAES